MSFKSRTFSTLKELGDFLNDSGIPPGQIVSVENNSSGFVEVLYNSTTFTYASGTGGATVTVPAGAAVLNVSGFANASDGTITIDGGDTITVRNGGSYGEEIAGKKMGAFNIVFSGSMDYYVSWEA